MRVGLVSDTHGYLDPRVPGALAGVSLILHAGDVGSEDVLRGLAAIAPVSAVAGNNDARLSHLELPERLDVAVDGLAIHLVHRLQDALPRDDTRVLVFGHSHKALVEERQGVLHVNPGAAGRVGFHREVTVALLDVAEGGCRAEIVLLGPRLPGRQASK